MGLVRFVKLKEKTKIIISLIFIALGIYSFSMYYIMKNKFYDDIDELAGYIANVCTDNLEKNFGPLSEEEKNAHKQETKIAAKETLVKAIEYKNSFTVILGFTAIVSALLILGDMAIARKLKKVVVG